MTQHSKRRGGRRPGSGRHRKRIYLNEETAYKLAELLWQQRNQLKRPELSADEVVCDLITNASEQSHLANLKVTQIVQEVFQRKWQEMEQILVKEIRSQFDSMYIGMRQQIQEEVLRNWLEDASKTDG